MSNTELKLGKAACIKHFWECFDNAIREAGGAITTPYREFTLQEVAELLAPNGIRVFFNKGNTITHLPTRWILDEAIKSIDELEKVAPDQSASCINYPTYLKRWRTIYPSGKRNVYHGYQWYA